MYRRIYRYLGVCLILLAAAFESRNAHPQSTSPNEWTWTGGSSSLYQNGVYGTLGTPAAGNMPGSRSSSATWVDANGDLWLFGGLGRPASGPWNNLNDLWKYDRASQQWTWVAGSSAGGQSGIYGTLGTGSAAANTPGARVGPMSRVDANGKFWLFGGDGVDSAGGLGALNDLWKFDPATNVWTWMGGSNAVGQAGVYGTVGIPAAGNIPGARDYAASWVDKSGKIWLFGGTQFALGNPFNMNELWQFDPVTGEWAWMGGTAATGAAAEVPGVYGTQGVGAAANIPGSRSASATWTDTSGRLWLFGGNGIDSGGNKGSLNDLWMFDPITREWAWMGGSKTVVNNSGQPGVYGSMGTAAAANIPGGRGGVSSWTDSYGRFFLFGGYGADANASLGNLGDLWMFNPTLNQWTWLGGSNLVESTGVYGTLGTPAATNLPRSRDNSPTWTGQDNTFWLFGGFISLPANQFNLLTDLWVYETQPPSSTSTPAFSIASATYNTAQTVAITDATPGAAIYYTSDSTTPTTNSIRYTAPITVSTSQTLKAIAIAGGFSQSSVATAAYTITPPGATPTFSVAAGTYTSAQSVAITDASAGALIYYTTDGTTPTSSSTLYSGPITVSKSETLEAIAIASGFSASAVATASYIINLPPPDFSIGISPSSLTVAGGTNGTVTVTVTPKNGFNSAVSFTCAGLPTGASCSFSPSTVTPTGTGAVSSTLTISTAKLSASLNRDRNQISPAVVLAALFLCFAAPRKCLPRCLLLTILAASGLLLASSCGGSSGSGGGTGPTPVTSTVTITATSGSIQSTSSLSITVN